MLSPFSRRPTTAVTAPMYGTAPVANYHLAETPPLLGRAVIQLDHSSQVGCSAIRLANATHPSGNLPPRVNHLFSLEEGRLHPPPSELSFRQDKASEVMVVGQGIHPDTGMPGAHISRVAPAKLAEILTPFLQGDRIGSVHLVASHADCVPEKLIDPLARDTFTSSLFRSLVEKVGEDRLPDRINVELGNIAVDQSGAIRSIVAVADDQHPTGIAYRVWDQDAFRPTMSVGYHKYLGAVAILGPLPHGDDLSEPVLDRSHGTIFPLEAYF